jgi:hypothetical protein
MPTVAPTVGPDLIRSLHTLGPHGTNLEAAAHEWFRRRGVDGEVVLHPTLESATPTLPATGRHAVLACAVYPALHTLVFSNLTRLRMVDSFLMPTHNMVLASSGAGRPRRFASHPAPSGLVPSGATVVLATSNSQAAIECAEGRVEGCVTTIVAARERGLNVLEDFGPVPMIFTVHQVVGEAGR